MPSDVSSLNMDEMRMRNAKTQLQNRHELEMHEIEEKNASETNRLLENHANQFETLRTAYDVQISEEAEGLAQRLHDIRLSNENKLNTEKRTTDEEVTKIKTANQKKIEDYKRTGESKMETLRKELQANAEAVHEMARRGARRDGIAPNQT